MNGQRQWLGLFPTRGIVGVLVTLLGLYFVFNLIPVVNVFALEHLALHPHRAIGPEPWQLITAGLISFELGGLLWQLLSIWLFGTSVEQRLGFSRTILILLGGCFASTVAMALLGLIFESPFPHSGPEGAGIAALAAFGMAYRNVPLSLFGAAPMRSTVMAGIFIGIGVVSRLIQRDVHGAVGEIAAALAGMWLASGRLGLADSITTAWDRFRLWRIKRRYKVMPGGLASKPRDKKYMN